MTKSFKKSNLVLFYAEQGHGDQALIFLHGLGSTRRVWDLQVSEFSKSYKVITVDLLGFGESSKNIQPERAISENVAILSAFLASLDVPWVVTAHSWSGNIISRMDFSELPLAKGVA